MNGDVLRPTADHGASERGQLAFSFAHRPALGGEDFLVAECNRDAVAWLDRWRAWAQPALVLHGPAACGKTHLGQVFLAATDGLLLPREALAKFEPEILGKAPAILIEDVDRDWIAAYERPLLHLYNWIAEEDRRLLLTARRAPAHWDVGLADLRSRVLAVNSIEIGPPDDALIAAVMIKQFADRQILIDDGVIAYLLPRIERSFAAVRALVTELDVVALSEKRAVTVPLAAQVLAALSTSKP